MWTYHPDLGLLVLTSTPILSRAIHDGDWSPTNKLSLTIDLFLALTLTSPCEVMQHQHW
jgi:hypothetical protein